MRPYMRAANVTWDGISLEDVKEMDFSPREFETYQLRDGDVLLSEASGSASEVGKPAIWRNEVEGCCFQNTLIRVRARCALPEYLHLHFLADARLGKFAAAGKGVGINHLGADRMSSWPTALPPLNEQRRIVAKLEALQARSRRAREALDAIPPLLEKLRQSILAAAFRGDLTKDWREKNPDVEPASELLKRIRVERRKKWEEAELAKMKAKGKVPSDDRWKAKYKEPEPVDASGLPELPNGWCWGTWGDLSDWITYGFTRPMPHVVEGLPVVTAKHVKARTIDFQNAHRTTEAAFVALSAKDMPAAGDLLITKDGTLGRAAVVPDNVRFCINQSVAVVWLRGSPMHREYLLAMAEAPFTQNAILSAAQGMAIQHLSVTDFARFPVPLAPLAEQGVVAERVEACLGVVGKASVISEQLAESLDSFNQSVLGKAFRGELVPQDPNDEPASVMLERVRAEGAMDDGNGGGAETTGPRRTAGRRMAPRRKTHVSR